MKKKLLIALTLILLTSTIGRGQELINIKNATSCENAIEINTLKKFGTTYPPTSLANDNPNNIFAKNQHPVWYKFKTEKDGVLLFDIIPMDTMDNYDFILYKAENNNFCQDYKDNKVKPERSNFYRTDPSKQGKTGLLINGDDKAFSKGIEVKKGEMYYLLINNVYENGQGHSISFKYLETFTIVGKVVDAETNQPVANASIIWENTRIKEEVYQITTDKKGEYSLHVSVSVEAHSFPRYSITAYADRYFLTDTIVPTKEIPKVDLAPINFKIKKIKLGYNSEVFGNIYFEPNEYIAIPEADRYLKKLIKMMMLNPNMTITLEGHTNGFYPSTEIDTKLSENRARSIKNYMIESGVDGNRITITGFGCNRLMYPAAKDEVEEGYNRRVEISITKF